MSSWWKNFRRFVLAGFGAYGFLNCASGSNLGDDNDPGKGANLSSGKGAQGTTFAGGAGTGGSGSNGSSTGSICQDEKKKPQPIPADLFFVLDKSGSMFSYGGDGKPLTQSTLSITQLPGNVSAWQAVATATLDFLDSAASSGIRFGAQIFPRDVKESRGVSVACDPQDYATPLVPLGALPEARQAFIQNVNGYFQKEADFGIGSTPTDVALNGAIPYATTWASQHPDRKTFLVLATDGVPTACDGGEDTSLVNNVKAILATAAGGNAPLKTYVISILTSANDNNSANADAFAQAGGTGKSFLVGSGGSVKDQFLASLQTIQTQTGNCEYTVPAPTNASTVNAKVTFTPAGGQASPVPYRTSAATCADQAGWYYDVAPTASANPTKLLLCPTTCAVVKAAPAQSLDVTFTCTKDETTGPAPVVH